MYIRVNIFQIYTVCVCIYIYIINKLSTHAYMHIYQQPYHPAAQDLLQNSYMYGLFSNCIIHIPSTLS